MKKLILLFYFSVFTFHYSFSQGVWTWMSGDTLWYGSGVYGTQGVPSVSNHPPPLYSTYCWTDLEGNFWLLGGVDGFTIYGDLWKFNPTTLEWTWLKGTGVPDDSTAYGAKGVASPTNTPGSRAYSGCTWVDTSGNLWLYGGQGFPGKFFSDLWKYNIASNEWTWMSGDSALRQYPVYGTMGVPSASNYPGSRTETGSSWVDVNGKFWLYGGYSNAGAGVYSDMWMYDPLTNEWTWESGSQSIAVLPVYGTKGVFATTNTPGAREPYAMITETNGNFLLFGGSGPGKVYADLWECNPGIKQWAWISGTQDINATAVAGTSCESDSSFYPDARYENRAIWKDCSGNIWLYGGIQENSNPWSFGDVWVYLTGTKKWARMSDSAYRSTYHTYGVRGVSSLTNQPGSRFGSGHWKDLAGNFWIFGGFDSELNPNSDMWRYIPDSICVNSKCTCVAFAGTISSSRDSICKGSGLKSKLTLSDSSGNLQWQDSPDGTHFSNLAGDTSSIYVTPPSLAQTTYYRIFVNSKCGADSSNVVPVHIIPAPVVHFNYTINGNQVSFLVDTVSNNVISYRWNFGDNQISSDTNPTHVFDSVKTYYVCLTVFNGSSCSYTYCAYVSLLSTGVRNISEAHFILLYPNPANDELTIEALNTNAPKQITITDDLGRTLIQLNTDKIKTQIDVGVLAAGIYFVKTQMGDGSVEVSKFVKE